MMHTRQKKTLALHTSKHSCTSWNLAQSRGAVPDLVHVQPAAAECVSNLLTRASPPDCPSKMMLLTSLARLHIGRLLLERHFLRSCSRSLSQKQLSMLRQCAQRAAQLGTCRQLKLLQHLTSQNLSTCTGLATTSGRNVLESSYVRPAYRLLAYKLVMRSAKVLLCDFEELRACVNRENWPVYCSSPHT